MIFLAEGDDVASVAASTRATVADWRMEQSFGGALPKPRRTAVRIHIGIVYASKRDQKRKWRFTIKHDV